MHLTSGLKQITPWVQNCFVTESLSHFDTLLHASERIHFLLYREIFIILYVNSSLSAWADTKSGILGETEFP